VKSAAPIFVFLVFAAILGVFIWIEIPAVRILVLQHRAESFPSVEGYVVFGNVAITHGSKGGVHYHPTFSYGYQVDGQHYRGRRYRYDAYPSFSTFASAEQVVKAHPVGSEIKVYYNPADPGDAVLSSRLEGFDLGILLISSPMWLIGLWGMIQSGRGIIRPRTAEQVAGGVEIMPEGTTTRVRLPEFNPLSWSMATIGVLAFIMGIMTGVGMTVEAVVIIIILIILAGAAVYFWLHRKISSGSQDLVVDETARIVQLPLTYKRRELVMYAFSQIAGVSLVKVAHRGKYGTRYSYAPTLLITDKGSERLTDLSKKRAEVFAEWLRKKLQLSAEAGERLRDK